MESKVIKEFVVTLNNYLLIMRRTKTRTDVNSWIKLPIASLLAHSFKRISVQNNILFKTVKIVHPV